MFLLIFNPFGAAISTIFVTRKKKRNTYSQIKQMKKTLFLLLILASFLSAEAQFGNLFSKKKKTDSTATVAKKQPQPQPQVKPAIVKETKVKKDWSKIDLSKRPADHLMIQIGSDSWTGRPDTINTIGFSRHFNFYGMMDKPFKTDKRYSVAYGAGFSTSNMYFGNTSYVNLQAPPGGTLPFVNSGTNHFQKHKLTTVYFEVPLEIRYYSNPENPQKSWKFAVGTKLGVLWKAYTKSKNYETNNNQSIYGTSYIQKEQNRGYINSFDSRLTARVGYSNFSLHGEFQLTSVVKPAYGPVMHTVSVGLTISGL